MRLRRSVSGLLFLLLLLSAIPFLLHWMQSGDLVRVAVPVAVAVAVAAESTPAPEADVEEVVNDNVTYSPYMDVRLCRMFRNSASIFNDLSTPYTSFYRNNGSNFLVSRRTASICSGDSDSSRLRLFIAIASRPAAFDRRSAIRETYASKALCRDSMNAVHNWTCEQIWSQVRYAFFVGADQLVEQQLLAEAKAHGDMVRLTKAEKYDDLSLKTLAMLHWTTVHCQQAAYVLKLDDDSFVNLGGLLRSLDSYPQAEHFIIGNAILLSMLVRDQKSPYFVPKQVSSMDRAPPYALGCGYVMPFRTAKLLYEAGRCVAMISIEDLFFTGFLRQSLNISLFSQWCIKCRDESFNLTLNFYNSVKIRHHVDAVTMRSLWKELLFRFDYDYFPDFRLSDRTVIRRTMSEKALMCFWHQVRG